MDKEPKSKHQMEQLLNLRMIHFKDLAYELELNRVLIKDDGTG